MCEWDWDKIEAQAKLNFHSMGNQSDNFKLTIVASLWSDAMNTSKDEGELFALHMAEFKFWLLSLNQTTNQAILQMKCGSPKRKCMDLFNDIMQVFNDNIRVDKPFDSDQLRPKLDEIGIPHKPYLTIAIEEEIAEQLNAVATPGKPTNAIVRDCPITIRSIYSLCVGKFNRAGGVVAGSESTVRGWKSRNLLPEPLTWQSVRKWLDENKDYDIGEPPNEC